MLEVYKGIQRTVKLNHPMDAVSNICPLGDFVVLRIHVLTVLKYFSVYTRIVNQ